MAISIWGATVTQQTEQRERKTTIIASHAEADKTHQLQLNRLRPQSEAMQQAITERMKPSKKDL